MSVTHVHWRCYGSVNTDDPEDMKRWEQLQLALAGEVRKVADPMWTEDGQGVLRIMHDGVSEP